MTRFGRFADVAVGKPIGATDEREGAEMATCSMCGNEYDKTFDVTTHDGRTRTFDSFECAIHALAPTCPHCGCRVIGHGVEADGSIYCCAHCAERSGVTELRDRA